MAGKAGVVIITIITDVVISQKALTSFIGAVNKETEYSLARLTYPALLIV